MKRRDFLKTGGATLLPIALGGFPVKTLAQNTLLKLIAKSSASNGRVLVLIQLNGGNDGLNTLIPRDQYANLNKARSNVLIPENKVLSLSGTSKTGLHPAMTGMRGLFDDGLMSIIQDAGYPDPNFSHFRSTDIWMSGSSADTFLTSGWLGRMLDTQYEGFPDGYPNADMPDPLAIQIGSGISLSLLSNHGSMGMAVSDPNYIYQMLSGVAETAPNTPAGHEITYIRQVAQQTEAYSIAIKDAAAKAQNLSALYPQNNSLADQLKLVARLIAGGLKTPVYVVSIGGFDTHANQVDATDKTLGTHANLLRQLSDAITAFQDDCNKLSISDKVAGMTFSEFGRRILSNASNGTDHGTASPQFVFGKGVIPGIIGENPQIPDNVRVNDNLLMQYDYRQIYASVIKDWFGIDDSVIEKDILYDSFKTLPIFKSGVNATAKYQEQTLTALAYPNPFVANFTLVFDSPGGACEVKLYNNKGKLIETVYKGITLSGNTELLIDASRFKSGTYYCQIITAQGRKTLTLVKAIN